MSDKKVYVRIELEGANSWLAEPKDLGVLWDAEIEPAIDEDDLDTTWTLTLEALTQEEYDALPEFVGH